MNYYELLATCIVSLVLMHLTAQNIVKQTLWNVYIHCESKNCVTLTTAITLSILDRLQNSFAAAKSDKFPTKPVLVFPPRLKYVAALPWET